MKNKYATKLTKLDLIQAGITEITKEGLVFKGETPVNLSVNAQGYLMLAIYKLDEEGNKIKKPITRRMPGCKRDTDTYTYELRSIGLHRAMWAWFNNEVPEGYVVDHISNKHTELEDYRLDNLQLLTPAENLEKERGISDKQVYCKLDRPLSYYENKLNNYLLEYEEAKANHNAEECHRLRSNISQAKARLRYYLAHKEEAEALLKEKEKEEKLNSIRSEKYHQVAKMKREIVEASKEMKWSQGKEIRKFIRNYQEDRDFEILVKLHNAILGGK